MTDSLTIVALGLSMVGALVGLAPGALAVIAMYDDGGFSGTAMFEQLKQFSLTLAPFLAIALALAAMTVASLAWRQVPKTSDAALGPLAAMGLGGVIAMAALFELLVVYAVG